VSRAIVPSSAFTLSHWTLTHPFAPKTEKWSYWCFIYQVKKLMIQFQWKSVFLENQIPRELKSCLAVLIDQKRARAARMP
jgi:hypothetical protein